MATVGVRELKTRASQLVRGVRERGLEVEVTYRGQVVARLVPVGGQRPDRRRGARAWSTLDRVASEIGARWPKGRSAADEVRKGRRSL
ncbi:MAG: type II toxin-antitoxin system prevent-host-death family antitoxin [Candidatus Rokubacteria bacterium]|nr:type II toxin-antitoxin system prevent-host-death family antitoxin [Candidatus Rokubacteria bacterium]